MAYDDDRSLDYIFDGGRGSNYGLMNAARDVGGYDQMQSMVSPQVEQDLLGFINSGGGIQNRQQAEVLQGMHEAFIDPRLDAKTREKVVKDQIKVLEKVTPGMTDVQEIFLKALKDDLKNDTKFEKLTGQPAGILRGGSDGSGMAIDSRMGVMPAGYQGDYGQQMSFGRNMDPRMSGMQDYRTGMPYQQVRDEGGSKWGSFLKYGGLIGGGMLGGYLLRDGFGQFGSNARDFFSLGQKPGFNIGDIGRGFGSLFGIGGDKGSVGRDVAGAAAATAGGGGIGRTLGNVFGKGIFSSDRGMGDILKSTGWGFGGDMLSMFGEKKGGKLGTAMKIGGIALKVGSLFGF